MNAVIESRHIIVGAVIHAWPLIGAGVFGLLLAFMTDQRRSI